MQLNTPLISVIIPVYKAEQFLDKCVESLRAQSYPNIEIILVDDGSPDGSPRLCDAWAEKDARIKVLHQANAGPAVARNAGVLLSGGEYISFVDSDDYVSEDYLEYLYKLLLENGADISCGDYRYIKSGEELFEAQPPEQIEIFNNTEACAALFGTHYMPLVTVTNKLFRRRVVEETPLPTGRLHEDDASTYKYYYKSGLTVLGTRIIYAYYQNDMSLSHTKTSKNQEAIILAAEEQSLFFEQQGCRELQLTVQRRLLGDLVYNAARGDAVCKRYLLDGKARRFLSPELDRKAKLRYHVYMLLRLDLTALSHRITGKKPGLTAIEGDCL